MHFFYLKLDWDSTLAYFSQFLFSHHYKIHFMFLLVN